MTDLNSPDEDGYGVVSFRLGPSVISLIAFAATFVLWSTFYRWLPLRERILLSLSVSLVGIVSGWRERQSLVGKAGLALNFGAVICVLGPPLAFWVVFNWS